MPTTSERNETPEGFLQASAAVDERRATSRFESVVTINLTSMGSSDVHHCAVEDVSEDGLFVLVPAQCGLMVGNRVEVVFANVAQAPSLSMLAGESCFATVVRTAALEHNSPELVGAGLRFDQPLFF